MRRVCGWVLMIAGAAFSAAMVLLAIVVIGNHLEWDNAGEAMPTVIILFAPPALAGAAVGLAGRWIHGGWKDTAPLRAAAPWAMRIGGAALAVVSGALLVPFITEGPATLDARAAIFLAATLLAGVALFAAGFRRTPTPAPARPDAPVAADTRPAQ